MGKHHISLSMTDAKALWRFLGELVVNHHIPEDKGDTLALLLKPFSDAYQERNFANPTLGQEVEEAVELLGSLLPSDIASIRPSVNASILATLGAMIPELKPAIAKPADIPPPAPKKEVKPVEIPETPAAPPVETVPNFLRDLKKGECRIFPHEGKLYLYGDVVDVNKKVKEYQNKAFALTQRKRVGTSNIIEVIFTPPAHLVPTVLAMEAELVKKNMPEKAATTIHA